MRGITLGFLLLNLTLIWVAARVGFASLLTAYASKGNQIAAADAAVRVSPRDPNAHLARGALLEAANDVRAATLEYYKSVELRPADYVSWLSLARARELNGDRPGAIQAARQATQLAPYYAQPHWQLGNILVRTGSQEEGFKELRLAGASNPNLLPGVIDLAWQLSGHDVEFVKRTIEPRTKESYQALAKFFEKRGEEKEGMAMLAAAGGASDKERKAYVDELILAKRFKEAYEFWVSEHQGSRPGNVEDAGFEQDDNINRPPFSWRANDKVGSVSIAFDTANPREGRRSLLIEFSGASDSDTPIVSQLVAIEPRVHYQLHFAARSENILSAALPQVTISDAGDNKILGQTAGFGQTKDWQDYTVDFKSAEASSFIQISVQREKCGESLCPIFGRLWLDNFTLQRL